MGDFYLANLVAGVLCEFKIEANISKPQAFYRETIRTGVRQEGKYSGLQVGEVQLLFKAFPEIRLNISSVPHILENRCISDTVVVNPTVMLSSKSSLEHLEAG